MHFSPLLLEIECIGCVFDASSAVWNSLPVSLRDPGLSLHSFRTKLKSHFLKVD